MYKYLSNNYLNNIIIDYNNKKLIIQYLNKDLKIIGTYILKIKYTVYLDNILNLFYNIKFKEQLKKLDYHICLKVIKDY